ncbi:MAG: SDR family oxidoreductase [Gammaproteobacteria bacterium]|nr:SDR family oxidoreductase [Gammaproteobacteria bacterium]MBT5152730.1 SDR family oxidoreductase [Gammaproteobacteria bacterium]MBT6586604.1 SDR family oxidoreductase [Gammaproteobacteria bacterium]MBT6891047.1 SDR family oxidoreductase [Gammaproteobacteria bacterium]MDG1232000.1 SDR family oxidoreductase [Pseudomonadales bacterium]
MAIVVITGCSSGIGYDSALAFARRGDRVYACVRNPGRAASLAQKGAEEKLDIRIKLLDVTASSSFSIFFEEIVAESERVDLLINNAGILHPGALEDLSEVQTRAVMETNFFGPLLLSRAVLPQMRAQQSGFIIMISSLSGVAGLAGDVAYSASKFALEGATEALRHEVDRYGIRLALVLGGQYATKIFRASGASWLDGDEVLPPDYPRDSVYRELVEWKLKQLRDGLPGAMDPAVVAKLLLTIADSDGSQLRWVADDLASRVLATVHGQSDTERDAFLRLAGGAQWWSEGLSAPEVTRS